MVNELGVLSEIKKILLIFDTLKVEAQVLLTKRKMILTWFLVLVSFK